ncbi:MAG: zinc-binding alcohol dehydrogenase [Paracoccaceae bacterium]
MRQTAHALVYSGPETVTIQEVALAQPSDNEVIVRTRFSGLSRGTERLIFEGRVPRAEWTRMRAPLQIGDFPFPVRYGYAAVGEVEAGPADLVGRNVFCLHPHQTTFTAPVAMALPLPDGTSPEIAVLGANMETALNAIWDAGDCTGQQVLIVGGGLVGCLIAFLLAQSGASVTVTDLVPQTGEMVHHFGVGFVSPRDVPPETFDVTFHTSASAAGLQTALNALAFEGRVIELSWYGSKPVEISLGTGFHANRLQIISSQVGHVSPARRKTTTHRDRLTEALACLSDPRLEVLITEEVAFRDLPDEMPRLLGPDAAGIATRIVYD